MGRFDKLERPGAPAAAGTAPRVPERAEAGAVPDSYPEHLEQADSHFYAGDFREALRSYSRALSTDGTKPAAWAGQVRCLLALRQIREATTWVKQALDHFPEDPLIISESARVLARNGDIKRAIGSSDYALGRRADSDCWVARGDVLLVADDSNARSCFEKAMAQAPPDDWRTPHRIALCCLHQRKFSTGLEYIKIACERAPSHPHTWRLHAMILRELNYTDRARDVLAHAAQLEPRSPLLAELRHTLENRSFFDRLFQTFRRRG